MLPITFPIIIGHKARTISWLDPGCGVSIKMGTESDSLDLLCIGCTREKFQVAKIISSAPLWHAS